MSVDDLLHLLERGAAFEQFAGSRVSGAAAQIRIVLEHMGCEPQRLLPEIGWRTGIVGKHSHDVLSLKHRPDAPADRLAAVGGDHLDRNAEVVADEFKELAQPHGFGCGSDLGRRADRQIDHKMR